MTTPTHTHANADHGLVTHDIPWDARGRRGPVRATCGRLVPRASDAGPDLPTCPECRTWRQTNDTVTAEDVFGA